MAKAKVKKPKVLDPNKEFLKKCNLIFSSLSARSTQEVYFNLADNLLLLVNGTIPTTLKRQFGSRIMNFAVGELSMHFVYVKDTAFFARLKDLLVIPEGEFYCIETSNMLTLMKTLGLDELHVFRNGYGDTVMVKKGRTTYEKKNVIGQPIRDFHIAGELFRWKKYVDELNTEEYNQRHPFHVCPVNIHESMNGRVFQTFIDMSHFKDSFGSHVFSSYVPQMKLFCVDGLTSVSIREFIKRMEKKPYRFDLYTSVSDNTHVKAMFEYEDDFIFVKSIRPNVLCLPVSVKDMSGGSFGETPEENKL